MPHIPVDMGLAIIQIAREISDEQQQQELAKTLRRYDFKRDVIFQESPSMEGDVEKKHEMISLSNKEQLDRSGVFVHKKRKGRLQALDRSGADLKLTSFVNPEIVNFITKNSPAETKIFVRFDPDYPHSQPPPAKYTQELPKPFLHILDSLPFGVFLQPREWKLDKPKSVAHDPLTAMHYVRGLRSLQMHRVNQVGYVDGYLEELVDQSEVSFDSADSEFRSNNRGPVLGRMIHFDTQAADETPCEEVDLIHLDLAINIYKGKTGSERLATPMSTRVEASERIHLLKGVPLSLKLLPAIAYLFLWRSLALVAQELGNSTD